MENFGRMASPVAPRLYRSAAALCARDRVAPRALDVGLLQRALTERGVDLFSE